MKKLLATLVALVALVALAVPVAASANTMVAVYGWALETNGARCGSDCQAAFDVHYIATGAYIGAAGPSYVSNGSSSCYGNPYNFGSVAPLGGLCNPTFNPDFNADTNFHIGGISVDAWIRHSCGGGGFYYSPTHHVALYPSNFSEHDVWYAGTLRLGSATNCFAMAITDAGIKAAIVG